MKKLVMSPIVLVVLLTVTACDFLAPTPVVVRETVEVTRIAEVEKPVTVMPTIPTTSPASEPALTLQPQPPVLQKGANRLWVNSVPAGADVFLLPGSPDDYEFLDLLQSKHFLGTTPLVAEVGGVGAMDVWVVVEITLAELEEAGFGVSPESDPIGGIFEDDGNDTEFCSFEGYSTVPVSCAKVYQVMIVEGAGSLISILIPSPEADTFREDPYLYPSLDMVDMLPPSYTFDIEGMTSTILDHIIDDLGIVDKEVWMMIPDMVRVLSRVGKVKLQVGDDGLIVEMGEPGTSRFKILLTGPVR